MPSRPKYTFTSAFFREKWNCLRPCGEAAQGHFWASFEITNSVCRFITFLLKTKLCGAEARAPAATFMLIRRDSFSQHFLSLWLIMRSSEHKFNSKDLCESDLNNYLQGHPNKLYAFFTQSHQITVNLFFYAFKWSKVIGRSEKWIRRSVALGS